VVEQSGGEGKQESWRGKVDLFNSCAYARLMGMEIVEVWEEGARVTMNATGMTNAMGVAHGGAVFALADQAFGIAANLGNQVQVAISAHINYLAPANGMLEAVAHRRAETEKNSLYEIRIYEEGRLIATFEGVAWKT
jgi:acyl-CoA thioesterase